MRPAERPYIIPIFISHLGCPFQCLYCQQERITAQEKWLPTPEAVTERVEAFLATRKPGKYSHTEIAFYGGTFTGLPTELMETLLRAAHRFVANGEARNLRASTKPDYITSEKLETLRRYGMDTVELGVQSLDDDVLRRVGRGYDSAEVARAVERLQGAGMRVGIQLMQGLPGGDEAEALASARRAIALRPDFVRLYPTVVLAGTALAELYRRGAFRPWSLETAVRVCRKLSKLMDAAGIPIIKLGLEFSGDEREGILAGPYHPRFRELVDKFLPQRNS
jgi:histone acetyltransferase (RNA polymerase elongator complex component)